jgi:anti-anti-sigma factor
MVSGGRPFMNDSGSQDDFTIVRHGDVTVITACPSLETWDSTLVEQAADMMLEPLRDQEEPLIVVDLSRVDYFGSAFLSLLIRCWKLTTVKGGLMVLSGVSERARELLRVTSLDIVWPIYGTWREAVEALSSD